MKRLSKKDLYGIWVGMTMSWDKDGQFDHNTYAKNTEKMCKEGVHGIYTTGSTGEFYAISYEEFCTMVDIQVGICSKYNTPLQIGCCSDSTEKTIKLMEYAASKPQVGAVQVNIPYWMELTDREIIQFFNDLYESCPNIPLIHYNIPRAKRFLNGKDYLKILEVAPSLIGVKYSFAGNNFSSLQESIMMTPQLSYFVSEDVLVSAMMLGAKGSFSSLIMTNPSYILEMYRLADNHKWDDAIAMQKEISLFMFDLEEFIYNKDEASIDPVADKGLAVACGCISGSQRTRPPYIGWSDETVIALRKWIEKNYPQFIYREIR